MHKKVIKKAISSWKEVYQLPLHQDKYNSWVWDTIDNFVFQFEIKDRGKRILLTNVINGKEKLTNSNIIFIHDKEMIKDSEGNNVILIRGWGNLTGTGAMNLPEETAAIIQDTFAEFIVEQLNKR